MAEAVTTVEVLGQLSGASWSTIVAENRITKLSGLIGRNLLIHASRVGIQCLTVGVDLQTAKIFIRCSSSCTSPESCHLKYFDFFELIIKLIAPTHSGDLIALNLLYCASWTTLKT